MANLRTREILNKTWFLPLIVIAIVLALALIANNPEDKNFWGSQISENEDEKTWEISVYATPANTLELFNKDKPAEQIVVTSHDNQLILTASVNVPIGGINSYTEESATILKEEWNNLLDIISSNQLLTFVPGLTGEAADNGDWGFSISGTIPNAQHWSGPPQKTFGPSQLMTEMAHITTQHIDGLIFNYLYSVK